MTSQRIRIVFLCTLACFYINNAHSLQTRVIGGRDPEHEEVKYLVAVQSLTGLCGGGIIDDKFIVTAAHCVKINEESGTLAKPTRIYAAINHTRKYDEDNTIIINVVRALLPKNIRLPYGDVAVLELEQSLQLKYHKEKLQQLELPEALSNETIIRYPNYNDLTVKFAGFGHSHLEEKKDVDGNIVYVTSTSGPLQVAQAKIIDNNICRDKYYGKFLIDSQICANIIEDQTLIHHQGVCIGDSGSPVVLENRIIVGLASFVTDRLCNTNIRPAVFTRISSHIEFIRSAVKGNTTDMIIISN